MNEKVKQNQSDFLEHLNSFRDKFEKFYGQKYFIDNIPEILSESIRYINSTGGKRIRPFLVYECASLFDVKFEESIDAAIAIEMVHTYSLIHDDLPAMDDDDMRRGNETLHKKYNEAIAILSGDALLTDSFVLLVERYKNIDINICIELIKLLSKSAGSAGMVGGQIRDLFSNEKNNKSIDLMNEMKTGALIRCATCFGAILGKGSKEDFNNMYNYGNSIGKVFQIKDDLLDLKGDEKILGKKTNKDKIKGKYSFVDLYGEEKAKKIAVAHITQAKDVLSAYGKKSYYLDLLADYILDRKK